MKTEISILKAYEGDCMLIQTFDEAKNPYTILIDGGASKTFDFSLRKQLETIKVVDLLVLTHIDSDHIGGLIRFFDNSLFENVEVRRYWINCKNLIEAGAKSNLISYNEAKTLEELLIEKNVPLEKTSEIISFGLEAELAPGITVRVLSPEIEVLNQLNEDWPHLAAEYSKKLEDVAISSDSRSQLPKGTLQELALQEFQPQKKIEKDVFNAASIAFILYGVDFSFLSLADSRAEVIERNLKLMDFGPDQKLKVDFVKVSHHGSKNNTSSDLLDLIDSQNFIISTNGGGLGTKHPDRETIARLLYHPGRNHEQEINLFFNYSLEDIERKSGKFFTDEEIKEAKAIVFDDVLKLPVNAPNNT